MHIWPFKIKNETNDLPELKKEIPPMPEVVKSNLVNTLTIYLDTRAFTENSNIISFEVPNWHMSKPVILPWKEFYKWYFSRSQSDSFMFSCSDGRYHTCVRREHITGFNVSITHSSTY